MKILTGIAIGFIAGLILAVIGWSKEYLDHKRIRSMEIGYIKDALIKYLKQRKLATSEASRIYNNPSKPPPLQQKSKKDIEVDIRFVYFRLLRNMLESNANEQSAFTALERWRIGSAFLHGDHLWKDKEEGLVKMCAADLDISATEKLLQFVSNMPETKGKALKLERETDDQDNRR